MKVYLSMALCFVLSCAPMVCRMDPTVVLNYSEDKAPKRYSSFIYVSYGALKIPFKLEKDTANIPFKVQKSPAYPLTKRAFVLIVYALIYPLDRTE